jgi:hypothetical protein
MSLWIGRNIQKAKEKVEEMHQYILALTLCCAFMLKLVIL